MFKRRGSTKETRRTGFKYIWAFIWFQNNCLHHENMDSITKKNDVIKFYSMN